MSQANHVPLIVPEKDDAFSHACAMEDPLAGIDNFALTLGRVAQTLDADGGAIVLHLAQAIRALAQELETTHEFFFQLHHPDQVPDDDAPAQAIVGAT